MKKLEANSEAPITPETTVQPENTEDSSTNSKPDITDNRDTSRIRRITEELKTRR